MDDLDKKIDSWRKQLLDLSRRNKMINFKETKYKSIPLAKGTDNLVEKLYEDEEDNEIFFRKPPADEDEVENEEDKEKLTIEDLNLSPDEVVSDRDRKDMKSSLYRIYLNQKESRREKGINTFYLATGMLEWYEAEQSDKKMKSPILFVPVDLKKETNNNPERYNYVLTYRHEEALFNPALRKKLVEEHGITLPEDEDIDLKKPQKIINELETASQGFERWQVKENDVLGIFDFAKFALYEDLKKNRETIKDNSIVRAISGDPEALNEENGGEFISADELDEKVSSVDTYQVLDADSSQQEAIEAAKLGKSFVLQGPPGTGKSQTIANIIAEKLADGEKILFVSEKEAALEVVKNRLEDVGIGRFCLAAHGRKASKKEVLEQIEAEMKSNPVQGISEREEKLNDLDELRRKLNEYGDMLFADISELGTPYEIQGELAKLEAPRLHVDFEKPLEVEKPEFKRSIELLEQLETFKTQVDEYGENFWQNITITSWQVNIADRIEHSIERQLEVLSDIQKWSSRQKAKLDSLEDVERYLEYLKLLKDSPEISTRDTRLHKKGKQLEKTAKLQTEKRELEEKISEKYEKEVLSENGERILSELRQYGASRYVKPSYRKVKKKLTTHSRSNYSPGFEQIKQDAYDLRRIQELEDELESFNNLLDEVEALFDTRKPDWEDVKEAFKWLKKYHDSSFKSVEIENDPEEEIEEGQKLLSRYQESAEYFHQNIDVSDFTINGENLESLSFEDKSFFLEELKTRTDEIRAWVQFNNKVDSAEGMLCEEFIVRFLDQDIDAEKFSDSFKKTFYTAWVNDAYKQSGLGNFNSSEYQQVLERFRDIDSEQMDIDRLQLQHEVTKRRPSISLEHGSSSEQVFLKREIQKQRNHKPLRKLFSQASGLITTLKPCFMMSPVSAAQYLPYDSIEFDTVIFDEASQVKPQEAVSSLIRAEQAIVVGDSKQLPPTRFFDSDVEQEDVREDLESILDETATVLPEKQLLWHYRSNYAELIEFSNHMYYGNRLITFPETEIDSDAVTFEYVEEGVYDRGGSSKNIPEARRVVDLIEDHVENRSEESLGVVAFSSSQEDAVLEELERRRNQNSDLERFITKEDGLEDFFVKRLEVVQGDERDRIIFSVGYGPDSSGKMSMNFGPLNKQGGERRLNVAVTRSRNEVTVVSSIRPSEIDLTRTNSKGAKHFKKYLEYAKTGDQVLERDDKVNDALQFDSGFEEAVYTALEKEGHDVVTQVQSSGYSVDLAIKHPEKPGNFLLGIECDGAAYHSSRTARDRDRVRQNVLENMGWEIHRIWSPDWTSDEREEIEKINNKVENLVNGKQNEKTAEETENSEYKLEELSEEEFKGHPDVTGYEEPKVKNRGDKKLKEIYSSSLSRDLERLVRNNGPIQKEQAYLLLMKQWEFSRVGKRINRKLDQQLQILESEGSVYEHEGFLWLPKNKFDLKVRINSDNQRDVDEISIEELAKASAILLENGFSIDEEDLVLEVARFYGFARRGQKIQERVEDAVDLLKELGLAEENKGRLERTNKEIDPAIKSFVF